jgi:AcrR family transcriptional regulator
MSDASAVALSGRRGQAARNDAVILDAARDVFLADPKAPIAAVAERAGVGISALYRRYANKEDLLRRLCADGLRRFIAEAETALAETAPPGIEPQAHGKTLHAETAPPGIEPQAHGKTLHAETAPPGIEPQADGATGPAETEPGPEEATLRRGTDGWQAFAGFLERIVDADVHSLTVRLAGTFTSTPEMVADARRSGELITELVRRAQAGGGLRPDIVAQDVGLVLESCAAIRVSDRDRTAQLRRRHLALLLAGLSATGTPLPGPPPRPGELNGRWRHPARSAAGQDSRG